MSETKSGGSCAPDRDDDALRCPCGALVARYVEGGIELKCRRCKRTIIIQPEAKESGS